MCWHGINALENIYQLQNPDLGNLEVCSSNSFNTVITGDTGRGLSEHTNLLLGHIGTHCITFTRARERLEVAGVTVSVTGAGGGAKKRRRSRRA